jgi:hypothetical protein
MPSTVRRLACPVLLLVATLPLPARAGEPGDHEKAFFIRTAIGAGYAKVENEEGYPRSISGSCLALDVAVGATVRTNLAIHGTWTSWASFPSVELEVFGETVSTDVSMHLFGGGLTYFFMPVNIYVSGSAGAAHLGGSVDSDWGWALNFIAGKEWWMSDRWGMERGLGVAGMVGYHSIGDPDVDDPATTAIHDEWSGFSLNLMITGTLN